MVKIEEFPQYLTKFDDIARVYPDKFVSSTSRTLNLDSVRQRKNGDLVNIEHHSSISPDLLRRDFEYVAALHFESKEYVLPYIFNTGKIPNIKIDYLNSTMFYNPCWINTVEIEASQKLNNIKYKLSNGEVISAFEILDLIWMPKFKNDAPVDEIILELVEIYKKLIVDGELLDVLRRCILLWIGKYITDENQLKKVKEGLNMSAMEIKSIYEDIRAARISGMLMREHEEGRVEGIKEGEEGLILKLLESMDPEEIASRTGVDLELILEIKNSK